MTQFIHDLEFRGADVLARLGQQQLVLCGAGAVGSLLADNLMRQGVQQLRVIDHDRVEAHNVNTQLYGLNEVGSPKAETLRNRIFRNLEIEVEAVPRRLTDANVRKLLRGADLVIDAFDNSDSRRLVQEHCRDSDTACLHVGLFADYCEVVWNAGYRVPQDVVGDVCEYPLARNIVVMAVAIASEVLVRWVATGESIDYSATLGDFAVRSLESAVR